MFEINTLIKRCLVCKEDKPATYEFFYSEKRARCGLSGRCKKCVSEQGRQWRKANREHKRKGDKEYREAHKEKAKSYFAEYHKKHRERLHRYRIEYQKKHSSHLVSLTKEWQSKNKDKLLEYLRVARNKRRARQKSTAIAPIGVKDIRRLFTNQKGKCYWCKSKLPAKGFHLDHIFPLSKGGTHTLGNLCIACQNCNRHKSNKMPHEFCGMLF